MQNLLFSVISPSSKSKAVILIHFTFVAWRSCYSCLLFLLPTQKLLFLFFSTFSHAKLLFLFVSSSFHAEVFILILSFNFMEYRSCYYPSFDFTLIHKFLFSFFPLSSDAEVPILVHVIFLLCRSCDFCSFHIFSYAEIIFLVHFTLLSCRNCYSCFFQILYMQKFESCSLLLLPMY